MNPALLPEIVPPLMLAASDCTYIPPPLRAVLGQ
jgi:hypothetical protein